MDKKFLDVLKEIEINLNVILKEKMQFFQNNSTSGNLDFRIIDKFKIVKN